MKYSIIIPTIHHVSLVRQCLDSFYRFHGKEHEVIVIDDGSTMAERAELKVACEKYGAKMMQNEVNSGFIKTVNKGMRAAHGDVFLLVNNDVVFTQEVISKFTETYKQDPKIGVVGSLLFYPNGTIQHAGIIRAGQYGFSHRAWHQRAENCPEVRMGSYFIAVTGALFGIKRDLYEDIGGMNEEFFLSCDDTEYCLRTWKAGWKVYYNGAIEAIHAEGATRGNNDAVKMVKGRAWMLKERETIGKFIESLKGFDFGPIERAVSVANGNMSSAPDAHSPVNPKPGEISLLRAKDEQEIRIPIAPPVRTRAEVKQGVIGVNRTGALGDVIMTTAIVRKLKETYPDKKIWVSTICPEVYMNCPYVERVVRNLREIPSAQIFDLDLVYEKNPKMLVPAAYAEAVFEHSKFDLSPELWSRDEHFRRPMQLMHGVDWKSDRVVVVHMSVGWPNRTWHREKWMDVIRGCVAKGYKVAVIGRGGDYKADQFMGAINLNDQLSVHEIRELMKRSVAFIGLDSGMIHVAQTTNVPIVGLFTCANPDYRIVRWKKTKVLIPEVDCKFCLHEEPAPVTFVGCKRGNLQCLIDIKPEAVMASLNEVLK